MHVAIESAALVVDKRWRVRSKAQATSSHSNLQIFNIPQISPQRPRAFRPADSKWSAGRFLRFSFRSALAEPNAKNLSPTDLVANLHQKCTLQDAAFMIFMIQLTFCITFFEKCCSKKSSKNRQKILSPKRSKIHFPGLGTLRWVIWTTYFPISPIF